MCRWYKCTGGDYAEGLCFQHHKLYGTTSGPVKKQSEIPKESSKQKNIKSELKKLYPGFLLSKQYKCEVQTSVCTKTADVIHHTQGRGDDVVLDQSTWMASCVACNGRIESHPHEGSPGSKVSRHSKKEDG